MSNQVKIILYAVLVLVASISGYYALTNFGRMMDRASNRGAGLEEVEPEKKAAEETAVEPTPAPATNRTQSPKPSEVGTNVLAVSNAISLLTNQGGTLTATNTNTVAAAATNTSTETTVPSAGGAAKKTGKAKAPGGGRMGLWTALFFISVIALGFLIASDVSHFMGTRALKTIYNDEGEGVKNPEYEQAEQVWADGNHLEAIGLMRDYLKKNPREQHVAMRIAEIYEKDLRNYLAAALEYEEVLKHKLPPDRWGWAAIHLCNLYFKLNQEQKGYDLLRRIVKEYPQTPAADKARKRLEQVDGASVEQLATEENVRSSTPAAPDAPAPSYEPPSNLPPGFRPKK
jgi:TolA-binding protein